MRYMLNKLNIFVLLLLCLTHPVNAQNKHKDNRENEAPKWAIYHRSFKTTEATAYLSNKQIPAEKGLFVEGEGKSLFLALIATPKAAPP